MEFARSRMFLFKIFVWCHWSFLVRFSDLTPISSDRYRGFDARSHNASVMHGCVRQSSCALRLEEWSDEWSHSIYCKDAKETYDLLGPSWVVIPCKWDIFSEPKSINFSYIATIGISVTIITIISGSCVLIAMLLWMYCTCLTYNNKRLYVSSCEHGSICGWSCAQSVTRPQYAIVVWSAEMFSRLMFYNNCSRYELEQLCFVEHSWERIAGSRLSYIFLTNYLLVCQLKDGRHSMFLDDAHECALCPDLANPRTQFQHASVTSVIKAFLYPYSDTSYPR